MRRLPVAAFALLAVATVGAFFVTQALKVTTPLVAGTPIPVPSHINPVNGGNCLVYSRNAATLVSFRRMRISFYLEHRADDVDVYMVDQGGSIVATLASDRHMGIKWRSHFSWDGREDDGRVAPDGTYYVRVSLIHQGRTLLIPDPNTSEPAPVTVQTTPPPLRITGVSPDLITQPVRSAVTIRYTGNRGFRPRVLIYRARGTGTARLVKSYAATTTAGHTVWNGTLAGGAPAPRGTYLVGMKVTDQACTTARFPARLPPTPGSDPGARVTVR